MVMSFPCGAMRCLPTHIKQVHSRKECQVSISSQQVSPCTKTQSIISWIFQIIAAVILFQTLFFKFTGAEESKFIFSTLNAEPWGRIGSGIMELIAAILLLIPRTAAVGAFLTLGLMTGAIGAHLTKLGIVVKDDGGLLFALAIITFISAAVVLVVRRRQLPIIGARLARL